MARCALLPFAHTLLRMNGLDPATADAEAARTVLSKSLSREEAEALQRAYSKALDEVGVLAAGWAEGWGELAGAEAARAGLCKGVNAAAAAAAAAHSHLCSAAAPPHPTLSSMHTQFHAAVGSLLTPLLHATLAAV